LLLLRYGFLGLYVWLFDRRDRCDGIVGYRRRHGRLWELFDLFALEMVTALHSISLDTFDSWIYHVL
jgi:hypothetical protein